MYATGKRALVLIGAVLGFTFNANASMLTITSSTGFGCITVSKLIVMPNSAGHVDWVTAINNAQSSIHMTMYHLTDKAVINALIARASDKSLDMRIILDGKSLTGGYLAAAQSMISAGVQLKGSTTAFSLTHSKDMVIDGDTAFVGAVDLTNTTTTMRDFAVITPDPNIISEMETVFEVDWQNAINNTSNTPPVSDPNLAWSPTTADNQLVALINSAQQTIVAESENLDQTDVINALNAAAAKGVNVRLVLPECSLGNPTLNYTGIAQLKGVSVQMEHDGQSIQQPYMHSKMMVVDNSIVYVGSINFSFNSITADREVGAIFADSTTAQNMVSEFNVDWGRSAVPAANPNCPAAGN